MSNIEKRNASQPETAAGKTSDMMIAAGVGALAIPVAAAILPLIGTIILALMLIAGGVVLGGVDAFKK